MKVVLLPGMDGTGLLFEPLVRELRKLGLAAQIVSYDPAREQSYDELVAFVSGRLPIGEPYVLVAESFSGPVGIRIAASSPPGLRALVLAATFIRSPVSPTLAMLVRPLTIRCVPPILQLRLLRGKYRDPDLDSLFYRAHSRVRPEVWAGRIREVLRVDVSSQAAKIAVPVLCLTGSADSLVSRENATRIAAANPRGVTVAELDAPHLVLQAVPQQAADYIHRLTRGQVI